MIYSKPFWSPEQEAKFAELDARMNSPEGQAKFAELEARMNSPEGQAKFAEMDAWMNSPEGQAKFAELDARMNSPEGRARFAKLDARLQARIAREEQEECADLSARMPSPKVLSVETDDNKDECIDLTQRTMTSSPPSPKSASLWEKIREAISDCFLIIANGFRRLLGFLGLKNKTDEVAQSHLHMAHIANQAHQMAMQRHMDAAHQMQQMAMQHHMDMVHQTQQMAMHHNFM
ncbi:MAG: hypothetical protein ACHQUC_03005 [Chlamydiales bacterium]